MTVKTDRDQKVNENKKNNSDQLKETLEAKENEIQARKDGVERVENGGIAAGTH